MFVCNYKCINEREEGTTTIQLRTDKVCFEKELERVKRMALTRACVVYIVGFYSRHCCCRAL